jgi:hypothetical protein
VLGSTTTVPFGGVQRLMPDDIVVRTPMAHCSLITSTRVQKRDSLIFMSNRTGVKGQLCGLK